MKRAILTLLAGYTLGSACASAAVLPESTKIDELLAKSWAKNGAQPNPPADDATLVRRLYLDIAGRIPTVEETATFLTSVDPMKRSKLIDTLLAGDGYTSHMFNYWADILRLTDNVKGRVAAEAYEEWLKKQLKANTPYDQMVRNLLTTDGGVWDSGAIGFYLRDENKLDHLAYTVQTFLGTQIVCAQCHNHPFDKWTQRDYYQVAGYTYGMNTKEKYFEQFKLAGKGGPVPDKEALKNMNRKEREAYMKKMRAGQNSPQNEVNRAGLLEVRKAMQDVMKPLRYTSINWDDRIMPRLPHDYQYDDAKPGEQLPIKTLFGHDAQPTGDETRLDAFARWMTAPENPRFTTVIANRMWKKAFGQGLIEPVDEMMDSTVASNPELMDYLTQLMIEKEYSLKSFLRVLYNTDAYQRAATTKEVQPGETCQFTGPLLRRMSAEQVWDSMVTLVRGNVDSTVDDENTRLNQYLDDLRFFMTTIKDKGAEGLVHVAKEANAKNADNLKKLEELRKKASEMNPEEARKLTRQTQQLRNEKNEDILVALLGEERANDLRRGYNPKKVEQQKPADRREIMAKVANMTKEQRKEYIKSMQESGGSGSLASRASEQPSPARAGSMLRTFGQSDREEIDNSSREASVPQALALLNGPASDMIASPVSDLSRHLENAGSDTEKVDLLYTAFLSRKPTAQEREILNGVLSERGDKALDDITHALLTGSQFLFVQ
jgi:hypothetical protein